MRRPANRVRLGIKVYVDRDLLTREEYNCLSPREQGYATYYQAERPGAVIPRENPHIEGSPQWHEWNGGGQAACIDIQETED